MTSIPASRSARAMIFAPRSCPSRPGLATTTRIFWLVLGADIGRGGGILCAANRRRGPEGPRALVSTTRRVYETRIVILMVGWWTSHTTVYVPAFVNRRDAVPFVFTREIVPRCGPFEIRTLCGSLPVHANLTVSPRLMFRREVPNRMLGPTLTVLVAAKAGTATAAATAATATRSAMRRFMRWIASCCSVGRGAVLGRTPGDGPNFPCEHGSVRG